MYVYSIFVLLSEKTTDHTAKEKTSSSSASSASLSFTKSKCTQRTLTNSLEKLGPPIEVTTNDICYLLYILYSL